jgi:HEPN domain-containing protein
MSGNVESARGLLKKAENDRRAASRGLDYDLPLDTICFHIQQTAEKLLKALLVWQGVDYPFTHDLRDLLDVAAPLFPGLREFYETLPDYTDFAVAMRYDDSLYPSRDETLAAFEAVERFRAAVHALLPPEVRS